MPFDIYRLGRTNFIPFQKLEYFIIKRLRQLKMFILKKI